MTKIYSENDANWDFIKNKPISVIGYGNQGRSQALNLRDSGLNVTVGNIDDEYRVTAKEDNFDVQTINQAAKKAEILLLLLPDEVAPEVYERDIHGALKEGSVLSLASGYNILYGYISPPKFIDLVLVAPRMGGADVRARYLNKEGFPSLVAAEQDYSGHALETAIALGMAIGSTQGALASSFEEETIVDLFGEQVAGMSLYATQLAYEVLLEAGCSPEASLLELYMSEELSDDWKNCARIGLWKQLKGHSPTSQYGQLTRGEAAVGKKAKGIYDKVMDDIKSGRFAREWMAEQKNGFALFNKLWKRSLSHPINKAEQNLHDILKKSKE